MVKSNLKLEAFLFDTFCPVQEGMVAADEETDKLMIVVTIKAIARIRRVIFFIITILS